MNAFMARAMNAFMSARRNECARHDTRQRIEQEDGRTEAQRRDFFKTPPLLSGADLLFFRLPVQSLVWRLAGPWGHAYGHGKFQDEITEEIRE
jgi:hypothetical protein